MAQAFAQLSGGPDTITFHDSSGNPGATWFKIDDDWTPQVAQLRRDDMGGRGPYEDVIESIPVAIGGSNAAHMYANAAALGRALQQANRWYDGERDFAVLFKYSPRHATVSASGTPLQAATWDTALHLSRGFNVSASGAWMQGAQMSFTRRGGWYLATETITSGASNSGVLVTFAASQALADYGTIQIVSTSGSITSAASLSYCWLICGGQNIEGSSPINAIAASALNNARYTTAADAANLPYSGSVLRYNGTDATAQDSNGTSIGAGLDSSRKFHVFATVRNNAAASSVYFDVYFKISSQSGLRDYPTPVTRIDDSSASPRAIYFGSIGMGLLSGGLGTAPVLKIVCQSSTAAGSPTLDFDEIVLVGEDDISFRALEFISPILGGDNKPIKLNVAPNLLTSLQPDIFANRAGTSYSDALDYRGDTTLPSKDTRYYLLWLITQGARWRFNDNGSLETLDTSMIRWRLTPSPE